MERNCNQGANRIPSFYPARKTINLSNDSQVSVKNTDNEVATKTAVRPGKTVVWSQKANRKKTRENSKPVYSDVVIRKPISSQKPRQICCENKEDETIMINTQAREDDCSYRQHSHSVTKRKTKEEERDRAEHFQSKTSYAKKDLRKKSYRVAPDDNSQSIDSISSKSHSIDNSKDTSNNPENSTNNLKTRNMVDTKRNFKFGKDNSHEVLAKTGNQKISSRERAEHFKPKSDSKESVNHSTVVSHEHIKLNFTDEKAINNRKPNTYAAKFNAKREESDSHNRKTNAHSMSNAGANGSEKHAFVDNAAAARQYAENASQKNSANTDGSCPKQNMSKNGSENHGQLEATGNQATRLEGTTSLLELDAIRQQHAGCCTECFRARARSADHIRNMSWTEQETSPLESLCPSNDQDLEKSLAFIRDAMSALEVLHKLVQNVGSTKHYLKKIYDTLGSSSEVARYRRTVSDGNRVDEGNDHAGNDNDGGMEGQDEREVTSHVSTCTENNDTETSSSSRLADGFHNPRESSMKSDGSSGKGIRRDRDKNLLELTEEWKKRNVTRKSCKEQNRK